MNIFVIPSWYPSADRPLTGIFTQEQVYALAEFFPQHSFGISLWGQMDERCLLWAKKPAQSLLNYLTYRRPGAPGEYQIRQNLTEYTFSTLSWTRKWKKGNLNEIISANERNMYAFEASYGKIDLIHAHVAFPAGWIAMVLSKKSAIPFLITEHSGPFPMPGFGSETGLSRLYREPLSKSIKNIAVSSFLAKKMSAYYLPEAEVIPNMVNDKLFTPVGPVQSESFVFFSLGRLSHEKGFDLLLNALAKEKDFFKQHLVQLAIGGAGKWEHHLQKLAESLGIQSFIQWLGPLSRTETAFWHQKANAFVLPSRIESFGVVYVEAMACGKPVIASRCGGPEDFVTEETGLLVEKDSAEKLAREMKKLVNTYGQYKPDTIRNYAMSRFSRKVVTKQLITLYEKTLSGCPTP